MDNLRKAAEMALEALEDVFDLEKKDVAAIKALRQALAQPVDSVNMSDDMIAELERENNMLRARNERQEKEIKWLETMVNNLQIEVLNLKNKKEAS